MKRWLVLLLVIPLALLSPSCAWLEPVKLPPPPLPVRPGGERATSDQVEAWILAGRVDAIVQELYRERAYADALVRDGEWAE